jgi:peptide/nickel transport system permease protein
MRAYYGLDQPKVFRYVKWIWHLLQGDAGWSYMPTGGDSANTTSVTAKALIARPVVGIVSDRLIMTIALTAFTVAVTWILAFPIGIYSAVRHNTIGDYTFTFFGFMGLAVPDFLLGLLLMYLAFAYLDQSVGGLFSSDYMHAPWSLARVWDLLKHLWIPAIVLGTSGTASLIRVLRNNMLDELRKPYVITARSKGMSGWRVVLKYPLRVAINPMLSTIGYLLPALFSGSVIVSLVLGLSTIGPMLLGAIMIQDTYLAGFIVLVLGILTIIGTFISDLLLAWADPRIRLTE